MNCIRQTQKYHGLDSLSVRFFIDIGLHICGLSAFSKTRQTTLSAKIFSRHGAHRFSAQLYSVLPTRRRFLLPSLQAVHIITLAKTFMPTFPFIEYQDASPEVRAVYDHI